MKSTRTMFVLAGAALALAGCATDPYYDGYYGSRYSYDTNPYYAPGYYAPGYYDGPSVGLSLGFSTSRAYDGRWRDSDRRWRDRDERDHRDGH